MIQIREADDLASPAGEEPAAYGQQQARSLANFAPHCWFHRRFGVVCLDEGLGEYGIYDTQSWVRPDGSSPLHDEIRSDLSNYFRGYAKDDSGYSAATVVRGWVGGEATLRSIFESIVARTMKAMTVERSAN